MKKVRTKSAYGMIKDFMTRDRRFTYLFLGVIFAVVLSVLIVQYPALSAQARTFDDDQYLVRNDLVQNPSLSTAVRFMTEILHPSSVKGYYQPLSMISLMMDSAMGGTVDNLTPFHKTSLLLHLLNVCLVILIIYFLFRNIYIAAFLGLVFGLHPMTIETFSWIGERKTVLASFFAFVCILLYILYIKKKNMTLYILSIIAFVLALLSKPTVTMLPLALLLLDFWPLGVIHKKNFYDFFLMKVPYFLLSTISIPITYISQRDTAGVDAISKLEMVYRFTYNVFFYFSKMIYPTGLSTHYPPPDPMTIYNPAIIVGIIVTTVIFGLVALSVRKTKTVLVGFSIFFIIILPVMGIFNFSNAVASVKYAYLPSIGLLILISGGLNELWKRAMEVSEKRRKIILYGSIVAILVVSLLLGRVSRNYLEKWKDTETLYKYMLTLSPNAGALYYDLGNEYLRVMRTQESIDAFKKAAELKHDTFMTFSNIGVAYAQLKDYEESIKYFKVAISKNPYDYYSYNNIGMSLTNLNRPAEAVEYFENALKYYPNYAEAYANIGNAYLKEKQYDKAEENLRKSIQLGESSPLPYKYMIRLYIDKGDGKEALKLAQYLMKMVPGDMEVRDLLMDARDLLDPNASGSYLPEDMAIPKNLEIQP